MSQTCTIPILVYELVLKHFPDFAVEFIMGDVIVIDTMFLSRSGLPGGEAQHQTKQFRILLSQVIDYGTLAHSRCSYDHKWLCAFGQLLLQSHNELLLYIKTAIQDKVAQAPLTPLDTSIGIVEPFHEWIFKFMFGFFVLADSKIFRLFYF